MRTAATRNPLTRILLQLAGGNSPLSERDHFAFQSVVLEPELGVTQMGDAPINEELNHSSVTPATMRMDMGRLRRCKHQCRGSETRWAAVGNCY